jgi:hypothetical protein
MSVSQCPKESGPTPSPPLAPNRRGLSAARCIRTHSMIEQAKRREAKVERVSNSHNRLAIDQGSAQAAGRAHRWRRERLRPHVHRVVAIHDVHPKDEGALLPIHADVAVADMRKNSHYAA